MIIQSLSLDVPAPCLNRCRFCVSHMRRERYVNQLDTNKPLYDLYLEDFERRLEFARDNGCNVIILTGEGEPLLNRRYLETFSIINKKLRKPFRWIEIQTSGTTLDRAYLRFLRNTVWVNTVSLSVADLFSSKGNAEINQTKAGHEVEIDSLCAQVRDFDFSLRLSLNMTRVYDLKTPEEIFARAGELGANQITFRVLYNSPKHDTPEDAWIDQNRCAPAKIAAIREFILQTGRKLEVLPFGAVKYSVQGIGTVIDDDCMAVEAKDTVKYLILRPNCKLYSRWDDMGSLLF